MRRLLDRQRETAKLEPPGCLWNPAESRQGLPIEQKLPSITHFAASASLGRLQVAAKRMDHLDEQRKRDRLVEGAEDGG
jgi:hypothetical protein